MTAPPATYNPALLTALDRLRFTLGDTDTAAPLLLDVTYSAMLAANGLDERLATIALADALIVRFSQEATSKSITNVDGAGSITWSNRLGGWLALAARLRGELAGLAGRFGIARPYRPGTGSTGGEYDAGGRSASELDRSW